MAGCCWSPVSFLVSYVTKELGLSRQCVHRWMSRYRELGEIGLLDRSSRPRSCPTQTTPAKEAVVVAARGELRCGPAGISAATGVPPRTVSRILKRQGVAPLVCCDPVTGAVIRAHRATAIRYERNRPGELVHIDIKKLGRIPDGGGWRALGRAATGKQRKKKTRIGFGYVHALVDDHTRLAYAEVLPDEKGATAAAFLIRASRYFAAHGIKHIERVLSDNAMVPWDGLRPGIGPLCY